MTVGTRNRMRLTSAAFHTYTRIWWWGIWTLPPNNVKESSLFRRNRKLVGTACGFRLRSYTCCCIQTWLDTANCWLAKDARQTVVIPTNVGTTLVPVEIPKITFWQMVDTAKVEPNARHPERIGPAACGTYCWIAVTAASDDKGKESMAIQFFHTMRLQQ